DICYCFGVTVEFPIIEDPSMVIAHAYGMIDPAAPDSASVRATFIIDPQGVVRAISWYPMNVGRSVEELLRLVAALQTADREGASAPEGWTPGAPLLEAAPTDFDGIAAGEGAWYYQPRPQ